MPKSRLRARAAETLEIPPEVALDIVKITLRGNQELRALNHHGIAVYESERIVFAAAQVSVEVCGSQLQLAEINEQYLRITGCIEQLRMDGVSHAQ